MFGGEEPYMSKLKVNSVCLTAVFYKLQINATCLVKVKTLHVETEIKVNNTVPVTAQTLNLKLQL